MRGGGRARVRDMRAEQGTGATRTTRVATAQGLAQGGVDWGGRASPWGTRGRGARRAPSYTIHVQIRLLAGFRFDSPSWRPDV